MYAEFFGLSQLPFSIAPDPRFLFMSERHREALAHLLYGAESGGGFVLLTGEIGAGKTTICRSFLDRLPAACGIAYIFNPKLTTRELLQTICEEFGIRVSHATAADSGTKPFVDALNAYLLAEHAHGRRAILIIDEAQNLSVDVLEQLRLLTNLETRESKLLQIMLIGQPELRDILSRPDMQQLAQRVTARYHLGALGEADTREYIRQRLKVAGRSGPLPFTEKALRLIHKLSDGVPRRINLLCDRALLGAYSRSMDMVNDSVVRTAAAEAFGENASSRVTLRRSSRLRQVGWLLVALAAAGTLAASLTSGLTPWPRGKSPIPSQESTSQSNQSRAAEKVTTTTPVTQRPASPAAVATTETPTSLATMLLEAWTTDIKAALPQQEDAAWPVLAQWWGGNVEPGASEPAPCDQLQRQSLQCFRTNRMSLDGIRALDRPAILTLSIGGEPPRRAVLLTMNHSHALLAASADQQWWVPLALLQDSWKGDYATLWRTPPGTVDRISRITDPARMKWVDDLFRRLQEQGKLDVKANSLKERTLAFQRRYGVEPHGDISTLTLLRLNMLSGIDEPRLPSLQTGERAFQPSPRPPSTMTDNPGTTASS